MPESTSASMPDKVETIASAQEPATVGSLFPVDAKAKQWLWDYKDKKFTEPLYAQNKIRTN